MENQGFKLKEVVGFEKTLIRGTESDDFFLAKICRWLLKKLYPWPLKIEDL